MGSKYILFLHYSMHISLYVILVNTETKKCPTYDAYYALTLDKKYKYSRTRYHTGNVYDWLWRKIWDIIYVYNLIWIIKSSCSNWLLIYVQAYQKLHRLMIPLLIRRFITTVQIKTPILIIIKGHYGE